MRKMHGCNASTDGYPTKIEYTGNARLSLNNQLAKRAQKVRRTHGRTDRRTDGQRYRVACTRLDHVKEWMIQGIKKQWTGDKSYQNCLKIPRRGYESTAMAESNFRLRSRCLLVGNRLSFWAVECKCCAKIHNVTSMRCSWCISRHKSAQKNMFICYSMDVLSLRFFFLSPIDCDH